MHSLSNSLVRCEIKIHNCEWNRLEKTVYLLLELDMITKYMVPSEQSLRDLDLTPDSASVAHRLFNGTGL